jgi:hypothetical protein
LTEMGTIPLGTGSSRLRAAADGWEQQRRLRAHKKAARRRLVVTSSLR